MRFTTPLSSPLLVATWALIATQGAARRSSSGELIGCPSAPSKRFRALAEEVCQEEIDNPSSRIAAAQADVDVGVYIHVIAAQEEELDGVTDDALDEQINVLNQIYGQHGFSFTSLDVTRDVNPDYSSAPENYPSVEVTRQFRQGSYADLNVYMMSDLGGFDGYTTLGYAQFPDYAPPNSTTFLHDGVAILTSTIPGGSSEEYNSGKNLAHEIGHWLGLFHTFEGGCSDGDLIGDTPAQATASDDTCISNRDTCPDDPGYDPVHNYMDYSSEPCQTEFTPGQRDRMHSMWSKFRAGN